MMQKLIERAFNEVYDLCRSFTTEDNLRKIETIAEMITACFIREGKVIICGNGGSNCDAVHFAEEFTGRFRQERKPLPVIAISDASHITCVANDYGFTEVFSRGVQAYGKKGDILIAISTSGNSENIIKAVEKANSMGMKTIGLLGKDGGKMKGLATEEIIVPGRTTDRIQEIHMLILHIIIEMTERKLFPENYE